MSKKFILENEEVMRILSLHKEQKNKIEEQTKSSTSTKRSRADLIDFYTKAKTNGCITDQNLDLSNFFRVAGQDRAYVKGPSASMKGMVKRVYDDFSWEVVDPATGKALKGNKWSCKALEPAVVDPTIATDNSSKIASLKKQNWKTRDELVGVDLTTIDKVYDKQTIGDVTLYRPKGHASDLTLDTSTAEFNKEQREFIDDFEKKGYEVNPTRVQRDNMVAVSAKQLGAPDDLFPNGLTLYYDPNKQSKISRKDTSVLGDILANQSVDRQACRKNVEDYFKSFKQKYSVVVDNATIYKAKRIVQACKDQYYPNKWGILGGGNKLNDYIEILSGDKGNGPTTTGDDSMWRLQ